jgi:hypothetical protein
VQEIIFCSLFVVNVKEVRGSSSIYMDIICCSLSAVNMKEVQRLLERAVNLLGGDYLLLPVHCEGDSWTLGAIGVEAFKFF